MRNKKPKYRLNLTWYQADSISAPSVLHYNVWIVTTDSGNLYYEVILLRGGFTIIATEYYRIDRSVMPWQVEQIASLNATSAPRDMNSLWASTRGYVEPLNELHWRFVVPLVNTLRAPFRRISAVLHYIRAPTLEPCEVGTNAYYLTPQGQANASRSEIAKARHAAGELISPGKRLADRRAALVGNLPDMSILDGLL